MRSSANDNHDRGADSTSSTRNASAELLTDPRFSDPTKLIESMSQLTRILDEVFGSLPMAHWFEVFNGVHVTFGVVREPQEVINDPQLRANDIVVPLEGAGGKLTSTISSLIQVHGVGKVPARRAPGLESTMRRFSNSWAAAPATSTACARAAPRRKRRNARRRLLDKSLRGLRGSLG
jgi:crotonobetainyl-CoA:carnitine CoA-transferase CaiB-like acyl-CoA transferase